MKVWKAELHLIYDIDNKWQTYFHFKQQDVDYKENKKFNEWVYFKNWIGYRIPMDMQVKNSGYSGLKVVQGFDHKLTEDGLKILEIKMREVLKKYLGQEKDNYIKTYLEKMNSI
ncbi:hypothetical protein EXN13_00880 [Clostridium botulinum]|nr:hypothetical protein [Clostridium botulinum]